MTETHIPPFFAAVESFKATVLSSDNETRQLLLSAALASINPDAVFSPALLRFSSPYVKTVAFDLMQAIIQIDMSSKELAEFSAWVNLQFLKL